ncbi:uncharacterized protein LOC113402781 [Vanessa tameamea]|uniref:Uncharacterized protein LOC113402781 n=1 Tax=Vanessa tameamea TaxID=334116 RepID=A0A8B8IP27_VANTA|nr:uncharacterized protein LOC113402781 [Vanessa tameamea]
MLLGVEVCAEIIIGDIIRGPLGSPCALNTKLGWILFGNIAQHIASEEFVVTHHHVDVENMLKKMWEIETSDKNEYTKEEKLCEDLYNSSYYRTKDGRYIVQLPKKTATLLSTEGETRNIAMKRLQMLEKRFTKDLKLKNEYIKVINEYLENNHMEEVPNNEINKPSVYLPHHPVIREDKETTKVRIVFDASCKGTNNVSINDELLVGPQLQEHMRKIIIRWRLKRICFVADIQQMYRQILVTQEDADFQRLLSRENSDEPVKDYRLLRVTFGTSCAPYLAVKTLHQVANDEGESNPEAANIIKHNFFIDDLMSGRDTVEDSINIAKEIKHILEKGGFKLQKWASNSAKFLNEFELSERSSHVNINIRVDGTIRALGLVWNMGNDQFQYDFQLPLSPETITKGQS